MQIDIRTDASVTPIRQTFAHIARRLGADKPATRYQEAMYDLQPVTSFHYRPLWQPQYELYDARRTRVVMQDWYALKDPRQYFYGGYVNARARQQETMEKNLDFVDKRGLLSRLPDDVRELLTLGVVPLRHVEWAANMNNASITAYGFGSAITQAAMYHTMDRLGIAQYLTRIGLLIGDKAAVDQARAAWMEDMAWQPLRHAAEDLLVRDDWFEQHVAQNLVLDGLIYPLVYQQFDARLSATGPAFSLVTDFMSAWYAETTRWVDATVKTAAQESPENAAVIAGYAFGWLDRFTHALRPLAHRLFGEDAESELANAVEALGKRLSGLGLARQ
ncbi:aromatic/alkene monooxygenase hydroxylase subunit beta [Cupriavidus metallidurans]|uniref:aromatic/alkene monooxygenase hydroxylase subunit beta n=1 Tax=Cupriavidus metallidurans TaxID=119219 RepID=UPI001CCAF4EF|nr:aromatic/alkene monooxygenase hydroxylase subunit beta [Cupriavidus metallidurans]UBM09546.1 aromatic/alkene monooxygenase hydroxylase subunit beta [Cupriavidus metallidurans]